MNSETGGIIIRITIKKVLRGEGEDHKQADFFPPFQRAGHWFY